MFNKFVKNQKKEYLKQQDRIDKITQKILDIVEKEDIDIYEMSDVLLSLQNNYNKTLLEKIRKQPV